MLSCFANISWTPCSPGVAVSGAGPRRAASLAILGRVRSGVKAGFEKCRVSSSLRPSSANTCGQACPRLLSRPSVAHPSTPFNSVLSTPNSLLSGPLRPSFVPVADVGFRVRVRPADFPAYDDVRSTLKLRTGHVARRGSGVTLHQGPDCVDFDLPPFYHGGQ